MLPRSRIAQAGLISAAVWTAIAFTTFYLGEYLVAGMSFLFLSFSLYIWETRR